MDLSAEIVTWLTSLRANKFKGEPRPHKAVLLLSVLELAEAGRLATNAVEFGPTLAEYFGEYWRAVAGEQAGRIEYPFWYMKSEPFWTLVPREGRAEAVATKGSAPVSGAWLREHVAYARLDAGLFDAAQDPAARDQLRGVLVAAYFPDKKGAVETIREFEQTVYRYTQIIRRTGEPGALYTAAPEFVRDAAFRRTVTEAYDYACAVSGARLTLSAGSGTYQLVQAAHIRDWADSHDDSPRNGISLSADYHWLFERGLFTLDRRWRVKVSPLARDCVGTVDRLLTRYDRRPIALPADRDLRPGQEYLDWHRETKYLAG